jgi:arsenate reductase-like glutaredoxin family protein
MTDDRNIIENAGIKPQVEYKVQFLKQDYIKNFAMLAGKPLTEKQLKTACKSVVKCKEIYTQKGIEFELRDLVLVFKTHKSWLVDNDPSYKLEEEADKLLEQLG